METGLDGPMSSVTDSVAARAKRDRTVRQWILWGGAAIILVMVYFSGVRAAGKRLKEKDQEVKQVRQAWSGAQLDLIARYVIVSQLEARRQVALAMGDLDKRNFGSAAEKLARASALLKAVQKTNAVAPDLSTVADELGKITLAASDNTGSDRERLVALAARMDAALGDAVPPVLQAGKNLADNPPKSPTLNDIPALPADQVGTVR